MAVPVTVIAPTTVAPSRGDRIETAGAVVCGGDRGAVEEVLADPRLRALVATGPWLDVPDPRRAVLDQAVLDAGSVQVEVVNA